jgi:hypothetical protein
VLGTLPEIDTAEDAEGVLWSRLDSLLEI